MATMRMYCPSLKENVEATITDGKRVRSKGGSFRNVIYGEYEGRKCLPKTVKADVFAQHGFAAESNEGLFCPSCKANTRQDEDEEWCNLCETQMMEAESKFDKLSKEIAEEYEEKGKSPEEAQEIGDATAAKIGRMKYGKKKFDKMSKKAEYEDVMKDVENLSDDDYVDFCQYWGIDPCNKEELSSFLMKYKDSPDVLGWLMGRLMGFNAEFTPEELTKSSAIHGDFDTASINYSGHQNLMMRSENESPTYCLSGEIGVGEEEEPEVKSVMEKYNISITNREPIERVEWGGIMGHDDIDYVYFESKSLEGLEKLDDLIFDGDLKDTIYKVGCCDLSKNKCCGCGNFKCCATGYYAAEDDWQTNDEFWEMLEREYGDLFDEDGYIQMTNSELRKIAKERGFDAEAVPIGNVDDDGLLAVVNDIGDHKGFIELEDDEEEDSIEIEITDTEMNEIAEIKLDAETVAFGNEEEEYWEYHVYVSDSPTDDIFIVDNARDFGNQEEAIKAAHEVSKDKRGKGKMVYVVAEEREMDLEYVIYRIDKEGDVLNAETVAFESFGGKWAKPRVIDKVTVTEISPAWSYKIEYKGKEAKLTQMYGYNKKMWNVEFADDSWFDKWVGKRGEYVTYRTLPREQQEQSLSDFKRLVDKYEAGDSPKRNVFESEAYDEMLNDMGVSVIQGYDASRLLRETDPIAYEVGMRDYESALLEDYQDDPTMYSEMFDEDEELTPEGERMLKEMYDDMLDESGIETLAENYNVSRLLKETDPIAYRVGLSDFESFESEGESAESCEVCAEYRTLDAEGYCSECEHHAEYYETRSQEDAFFSESEIIPSTISKKGKMALGLTALGLGFAMIKADKIADWFNKR